MTRRTRKTSSETPTVTVRLAGVFSQGAAIDRSCNDEVHIPVDAYDETDDVYRVARGVGRLNIRRGDLLIIEPRSLGRASSGEFVLAEHDGRAYVGRWWRKRGRRALLDEKLEAIAEGNDLRVLGAITMVVRLDDGGVDDPK